MMSRIPWSVVLAVATATFGMGMLIREIWPSADVPPPPRERALLGMEKEKKRPPLPMFSQAVSPELETRVSLETAGEIAGAIAEAARRQLESDREIASLGAVAMDDLVATIRETSEVFLSGDFDRHARFLSRTRGRYLEVENARTAEERETALSLVRRQWEALAEATARNPISLAGVRARLRYLRGVSRPTDDDAHVVSASFSPERWPAISGDPAVNGYTIVEIRWPVFYFRTRPDAAPVSGPAYFAVWLVWDESAAGWRIHQTRMYDPLRLGASSHPAF